MKKGKDYVNNEDFIVAFVAHQNKCKEAAEKGLEEPRLPNYIGETFLNIAENLSHSPKFISYSYRDEMVSDAIENCMKYWRNFDPNHIAKRSGKVNAFAYFTQICWYAFLQRIAEEKKQTYVKYKETEIMGYLNTEEISELEEEGAKPFELYNNISEFISDFEKKMEKKPVKSKKGIDLFFDNEEQKND